MSEYKRKALNERRAALLEEYEAANEQLSQALGSVERLRIQRQMTDLDQQIQKVDKELAQIAQTNMHIQNESGEEEAPIGELSQGAIRDLNVTFGGGTIVTGAQQVVINQLSRSEQFFPTGVTDELASLERQLEKLKRNLRAIREKRADFIDPRSTPPDLEESERLTREEIVRIEARLAELKAQ